MEGRCLLKRLDGRNETGDHHHSRVAGIFELHAQVQDIPLKTGKRLFENIAKTSGAGSSLRGGFATWDTGQAAEASKNLNDLEQTRKKRRAEIAKNTRAGSHVEDRDS